MYISHYGKEATIFANIDLTYPFEEWMYRLDFQSFRLIVLNRFSHLIDMIKRFSE